jgi:hypothetical protein
MLSNRKKKLYTPNEHPVDKAIDVNSETDGEARDVLVVHGRDKKKGNRRSRWVVASVFLLFVSWLVAARLGRGNAVLLLPVARPSIAATTASSSSSSNAAPAATHRTCTVPRRRGRHNDRDGRAVDGLNIRRTGSARYQLDSHVVYSRLHVWRVPPACHPRWRNRCKRNPCSSSRHRSGRSGC